MSDTCTTVLPHASASNVARWIAGSLESSPRTTSTSGIIGAGLKKCIPTTRSAKPEAAPSSLTESDDVFVARIAFVAMLPTSLSTFVLMSKSSTIASTIRSQSDKSSSVIVVVIRSWQPTDSSTEILPFSTRRINLFAMFSFAWSTRD